MAGILTEQVVLEGDGAFQYRYRGSDGVFDSAAGTYAIVKNKLILTYKPTHIDSSTLKPLGTNADPRLQTFAVLPRFFVLQKKRLYRADENGNALRTAPGASGNRRYGLVGSRKRKYYLRLLRS